MQRQLRAGQLRAVAAGQPCPQLAPQPWLGSLAGAWPGLQQRDVRAPSRLACGAAAGGAGGWRGVGRGSTGRLRCGRRSTPAGVAPLRASPSSPGPRLRPGHLGVGGRPAAAGSAPASVTPGATP